MFDLLLINFLNFHNFSDSHDLLQNSASTVMLRCVATEGKHPRAPLQSDTRARCKDCEVRSSSRHVHTTLLYISIHYISVHFCLSLACPVHSITPTPQHHAFQRATWQDLHRPEPLIQPKFFCSGTTELQGQGNSPSHFQHFQPRTKINKVNFAKRSVKIIGGV